MKYNPIITNPKKLRQVLNAPKDLNIEDLATISGYSLDDIFSKNRVADLAEWRQVIQTYLRSQEFTLLEIGNLTNRHHSTVIHSCNNICDLAKMHDKKLNRKLDKLRNAIGKPAFESLLIPEALTLMQNEFNRRLN